jgi:predicted enzyme related to lactoylglutathione lyase
VDDVETTAKYYRDTVGFQYQRIWGEGPRRFCIVMRNGISIMLKQIPAKGKMSPNHRADPEDENWDAYVYIDDADALYKQFIEKGVKITRPICNQEYGCRDFEMEDCNGYRLCFGQDLEM